MCFVLPALVFLAVAALAVRVVMVQTHGGSGLIECLAIGTLCVGVKFYTYWPSRHPWERS